MNPLDAGPRPEAAPDTARPCPRLPPVRKRILVADDDYEVRTSVGKLLAMEGYETILARTGHDAVATMAAQPVDLMLLDINLPDKDGWETFRLITTLNPFLPVIVITGLSCQSEHARRAGIDELMEKPLDLPLLLQSIRRLLAEADRQHLIRVLNQLYGRLPPENRRQQLREHAARGADAHCRWQPSDLQEPARS